MAESEGPEGPPEPTPAEKGRRQWRRLSSPMPAFLQINAEGADCEVVDVSSTGAFLRVIGSTPAEATIGALVVVSSYWFQKKATVARRLDHAEATHLGVAWDYNPSLAEHLLAEGGTPAELLYIAPAPTLRASPSRAVVVDTYAEIKKYLAANPERLRDLTPRSFEVLIASVLQDLGFDVQLTQATRDGGVDIYAYVKNEVTSFLTLVECKRFGADRPVGIEIVQRLFGIQQARRAAKALIVTTSYFSAPAKEECRQYYPQMELKDFEHIRKWLRRYLDEAPPQ